MDDVISHIQTFRDYFHYHIKASKVSRAAAVVLAVAVAVVVTDANQNTPRHISTLA